MGELRRSSFDVTIIGLDLPDVDGLGFIELIRKENPHLLIIALGVSSSKSVATAVLEAGADEYLPRDSSCYSVLPDVITRLHSRRPADARESRSTGKHKQNEQANIIRVTAGTLYHEVNNPLMTIVGLCELILGNGHEYDREVTKKVRIIQRSARRIQSALTRLSTVSQPSIRETVTGALIDTKRP